MPRAGFYLKTSFKYGLPLSLLYCTVYKQDIWREGDERLYQEQRQSWKNLFNFVDSGIKRVLVDSGLKNSNEIKEESKFLAKLSEMDFTNCWNSKVRSAFSTIDNTINNPGKVACRLYRRFRTSLEKTDKTEPKTELSS